MPAPFAFPRPLDQGLRHALQLACADLAIYLAAILEGEIYYSKVCADAIAGRLFWPVVLTAGALGGPLLVSAANGVEPPGQKAPPVVSWSTSMGVCLFIKTTAKVLHRELLLFLGRR